MNTAFVIITSILIGLASLFLILGLVYSRIRKKLEKLVTEKFDREEILGATTRANFFGIKSKGGAQVRGNGALVLTRNALHFIRAVPQTEYHISLGTIRSVSTPKTFNGKSVLVPLLCVHYETESGQDSMAWAVKDVKKWKEAIEKLTT